ncbi:hypothetical protein [Vibrio paucivorans]|uniref:Uncharacterized protein n=1 Tax=Vibrio paucivorans TaxID=2829489 RepID=A0A9X3CD85_9VIBR|nr:hypothetical protein [Vibrio paucivorans]MCW8333623.1 hypothetical protein [Vibrio paucivorans]
MNYLERTVYDLVKKNAKLKNKIVTLYQLFFSVFGLLKKRIDSKYKVSVYEDCFFGFHDKPSINKSGLMIAHKNTSFFSGGMGESDVGFFDISDPERKFTRIAHTNCCNYQQGSMASWLDEEHIIFNNVIEGRKVSQVYNLQGELQRELDFHIFSVSSCGRFVTSLCFKRFGVGMPGYGYKPLLSSDTESSSLFVFDLKESVTTFTINLEEASTLSSNLLEDGYLYFSHTKFSPDGESLYFMLRSSNSKINTSQLFVCNISDNFLQTVPGGGMVSHLDWMNSESIVMYCNNPDGKDGYYVWGSSSNSLEPIGLSDLTEDGHPTVLNSDIFFTDTYPNRSRRQFLYRVDIKNNLCETILSSYGPLRFKGVNRVDLHPRLSACGQYLSIDSSHLGKRSQIVIYLV